jgi:hypothetical protein
MTVMSGERSNVSQLSRKRRLIFILRMMFSENRFTLFGIMR